MLEWFKGLDKTAVIVALMVFLGVFVKTFGPRLFRKKELQESNDGGLTISDSAEEVLALIRQGDASNAPSSPAEIQTIKEAITRLVTSQDAQKQQVMAALGQGDFDGAIAKFEVLDQEQS